MEKLKDGSRKISRRNFLSLSATLALGTTLLSLPIPYEAVKLNQKLYKVSFNRPGMGTFVNITVLDSSRDRADVAIEKGYQEMDRLVGLFSRFDSSSPVSLLNQDGYLKDPPSELLQLLNVSIHYNLISNGAFDITVLPILTLIEKSFSTTGKAPAEYELNKMRSVVGSRHLMISEGCVSFARSGMAITLDSIAKGFIVDKVMATLHAEGVRHALVNGGGDIAVLGGKGEGRPWRIAIQDPHKQGHSVDVLSLYTGAVATSGSYEIFFDQEKLYHHLISSGEFLPANENTSVSVRAPSVMTADALATAVFVMGPAQGARFLDSQQIIEGLIISNNNKTFSSSQWQG